MSIWCRRHHSPGRAWLVILNSSWGRETTMARIVLANGHPTFVRKQPDRLALIASASLWRGSLFSIFPSASHHSPCGRRTGPFHWCRRRDGIGRALWRLTSGDIRQARAARNADTLGGSVPLGGDRCSRPVWWLYAQHCLEPANYGSRKSCNVIGGKCLSGSRRRPQTQSVLETIKRHRGYTF